jgi:hypothetical protein
MLFGSKVKCDLISFYIIMTNKVFDSSKYDSVAEMKKTADMQEKPAITEVQISNVNVNSPHITTTVADTNLPNLKEIIFSQ